MKDINAIAKTSARGSVILSVGLVVSNLVLALGVFLIARFLSAAEYGLYSIVLTVPSVLGFFQDLGVNSALVKYSAQARANNETVRLKRILATALIFNGAIGAGLSIVAFLSANFLAGTVLGRPEIEGGIRIASLTIFTSSIISAAQSTFIGFEKQEFYALTLIISALLKVSTATALILAGFGVNGAIAGYLIASAAVTIIGFTLFLSLYRKVKAETGVVKLQFRDSLAFMLRYGIPLSISAMLSGLLGQLYNFLLYRVELDNAAIGSFQIAGNFLVFLQFLTIPIATTLFPAFSKLDMSNDQEILRRVFQSSVKYASFLVLPATFALMVLAYPLVRTLFGNKYSDAPVYLVMLAMQGLYVGVGNLSITNLLNGQGKTNMTLKLSLLTVTIGIALSLLFIPALGIAGLIITSLTSGLPSLIIGSWWVKKQFTTSVDKSTAGRLYLSSALAGAATYLILLNLSWLPIWISLAVGGGLFLSLYLIFIGLTHALDRNDILAFRGMFKEMGPLTKIIELFLRIIERLNAATKFKANPAFK